MTRRRTRALWRAYVKLASDYDRRWPGYVATSTEETLRRMELRPEDRLLDIGCGTGALLAAVRRREPRVQVTGIDLVPAMLSVARRRAGGHSRLAAADAEQLPFPAGSFDVVVSASSFHHWSRPEAGLEEIARVLGQGGRLVLTDWCGDFLACRVMDLVLKVLDPAYQRAYQGAECIRLLAENGFDLESFARYKADWLWGLMTASAIRPPASAAVSGPARRGL